MVGPDDRPLAPGAKGEIVVRPLEPDVMLIGYWRQARAELAACRNFWFHTGDLGSFDADGYLYFHGRMKELIRRGGEMISPAEIETCLRRMPGRRRLRRRGRARRSGGRRDQGRGRRQRPASSRAAVHAFLSERLAPFLLPRYIEFLAAIPKTETEKIQRNKLQYLDERVHDLKLGRRCTP